MLLADDKGAELIVAVGTHATLVEFLDKGRAGMASTFLTRLRVGRQAGRRQGRQPALPQPDLDLQVAAAARGRRCSRWSSRSSSTTVGRPAGAGRRPLGRLSCPGCRAVLRDRLPVPHRLDRRDLPGAGGGHRARCRAAAGGPRQDADQQVKTAQGKADLRSQLDQAQRQLDAGDEFATAVTPELVALAPRRPPVVLVTLPGADADSVSELPEVLTAARGHGDGTVASRRPGPTRPRPASATSWPPASRPRRGGPTTPPPADTRMAACSPSALVCPS